MKAWRESPPISPDTFKSIYGCFAST